jgi:hypothetical protein
MERVAVKTTVCLFFYDLFICAGGDAGTCGAASLQACQGPQSAQSQVTSLQGSCLPFYQKQDSEEL